MIRSVLKDYSKNKSELERKDKNFKSFKLKVQSKMDQSNKEHDNKSKRFKTKFSNYSK